MIVTAAIETMFFLNAVSMFRSIWRESVEERVPHKDAGIAGITVKRPFPLSPNLDSMDLE
ncbi:hypothetical protein [Asticcacaulis sp. W401b]|uniref:hypothetical protein n=1 Tax=Asticcacaulis sp. W401b TaxID=3388666 RepID=UPI0039706AE0